MARAILLLALFFSLVRGVGQARAEDELTNSASSLSQHINYDTSLTLTPQPRPAWEGEPDGGTWAGMREFDIQVADAFSANWMLRHRNHDLALARFFYGGNVTDLWGPHRFYQGCWELLGEFFGGAQYHPDTAYVVGGTAIMRYNFITGTRWMPFIEGGAGATATDIGRPDLGMVYEFNLQGAFGIKYFVSDRSAVTLTARYMHMSDAGLKEPNQGVNTTEVAAGWSWFF